jgi:cbb3-type cytochrome oxidase cytochrome c subunit
MNYGPLLFLAAFFALAGSWSGFVLTPQLQLGRMQQTNTVGGAATTYPVARPGLAGQGLQVYRANGCAYCHSQQVGQTGTLLEIALTDAGTNQAATIAALLKLAEAPADQPTLLTALGPWGGSSSNALTTGLLSELPKSFLRSSTRDAANAAVKTLNATSAKAQLLIVPVGPDLARGGRGWGRRRSVAEDFLYDSPVMPGSQRVGPDLANVGSRQPDANSLLLHLYAPQTQVKGSTMPPYRFLFEKRRIRLQPSPEALVLPAEVAPPTGYEVVPKPAAQELAAYLVSLRANAPLFSAPLTVPAAAAPSNGTNAPAAPATTTTNSPTAAASAK